MNTQQPTDINQVAQTREALPSSMRYALGNADAIPSSTIERMFLASNGSSFSPTTSNEIRIPVQAGEGFLDTAKHYLFFTITNDSAGAKSLDGDISSIINQVRITSQGVELERLDDYALLHNFKNLYNASYTDRELRNAKSGGPVAAIDYAVRGASITNAESGNFAVQLDSGFLLGHHKKALPMGMAGFEIVIRLNTGINAMISPADTATAYTITNPRFYCPVYKIEDMNVLNQYKMLASQRGISWSGDTNKLYMGSITAGAGKKTIQINDRSLSLKGLITMVRPNAIYQLTRAATNSGSAITGLSQYNYQIGGLNYPQVPVDMEVAIDGLNICRAYDQAIKSFADPGFSHSEPLVNKIKFAQAYPADADLTANNTLVPQGVVCIDLRRFDDERLSYVGLNTAKNASPNILEITGAAAAPLSTTNTYAICEAEYTMSSQGALSVVV
mgnify:CR=1 FL=1|tara:strand:+ start:1411 stop:2748 length:1338 start_codon:yes stop_codon:yes gene_type:complete